jgi:FkbM family methyltransferase
MFVSYAQNFEDVILWRALKHVALGFYVDIGAQDPVADSVSLSFYQRGWRGVHVEPVAQYAQKLRAARPDEQVIEAAIGRSQKTIRLFEFPDTGLSTASEAIAQTHIAKGFSNRSKEVACIPLSQLLDAQGDRPIHWLKIDVEGMEQDVIESWPPSLVRPWIVIVESTKPNSREASFTDWEPKLLALGYEFAYFDGLNRFYVSVGQPELKAEFGIGPNLFDDFSVSEHSQFARQSRSKIERQKVGIALKNEMIAAHQVQVAALKASVSGLREKADAAKRELAAVYSSTSWKVTALVRGMKQPKHSAGRVLEHALIWINRHPGLKGRVRRAIRYAPRWLQQRMLAFARPGVPRVNVTWALEPDPAVFSEWETLVSNTDRK